ncbi:unnamed protein product [Paramecium sonneborni]|uniref:Uncharacterized protein n=1 Tax=Paramecium sonneborni TaxID=65129 RepID=A0A8S1RUR7_9CILI|nr:unnamed protein product [Paramecium sonneborni]
MNIQIYIRDLVLQVQDQNTCQFIWVYKDYFVFDQIK